MWLRLRQVLRVEVVKNVVEVVEGRPAVVEGGGGGSLSRAVVEDRHVQQ